MKMQIAKLLLQFLPSGIMSPHAPMFFRKLLKQLFSQALGTDGSWRPFLLLFCFLFGLFSQVSYIFFKLFFFYCKRNRVVLELRGLGCVIYCSWAVNTFKQTNKNNNLITQISFLLLILVIHDVYNYTDKILHFMEFNNPPCFSFWIISHFIGHNILLVTV